MIYEKPAMKDWVIECDFCHDSQVVSDIGKPSPPDGWFYIDQYESQCYPSDTHRRLKCAICVQKERQELNDVMDRVFKNLKKNG